MVLSYSRQHGSVRNLAANSLGGCSHDDGSVFRNVSHRLQSPAIKRYTRVLEYGPYRLRRLTPSHERRGLPSVDRTHHNLPLGVACRGLEPNWYAFQPRGCPAHGGCIDDRSIAANRYRRIAICPDREAFRACRAPAIGHRLDAAYHVIPVSTNEVHHGPGDLIAITAGDGPKPSSQSAPAQIPRSDNAIARQSSQHPVRCEREFEISPKGPFERLADDE